MHHSRIPIIELRLIPARLDGTASSKDFDIIGSCKQRLLRKGGKLLVVDWQDKDSPDWSITRGTFGETRACFCRTAVGLIFERDFEAGPYHFGLIFIKS